MRKACEWSNYKLLLYWINTLEIKITKEIWVIGTKVAKNGNIPIRNYEKVELQLEIHNTLGRLDDGTNELTTKRLMLQVLFFFHDFLQNSL